MSILPPPRIMEVDGYTVIDDSTIGTKFRMATEFARRSLRDHFFYATTPSGDSPGALAKACHEFGKKLTLLTTEIAEKDFTPVLKKARDLGAEIISCPTEKYEIVSDIARMEANAQNGECIDFDDTRAIHVLADIARSLNLTPAEVWSASAKGAMARSYQIAWPQARHNVVAVLPYAKADFGLARVFTSKMPYKTGFLGTTAFPCNRNYEAKAWEVMKKHAKPYRDVVFWNPAGPN